MNELEGRLLFSDSRLNEKLQTQTNENFIETIWSSIVELEALELQPNERLLVVTHGHVLSSLLMETLGAIPELVRKTVNTDGTKGLATHLNCALSAFSASELLMWNFQGHLMNSTVQIRSK